jgi:asparagine synthetase B (glutamine-hydrolysing)
MTLRIVMPPHSMFRRIRKLPPAHTLVFELEQGLRISRYWDLEYEPKLSGADGALADRLEQEIVESLRAHIVSDVPIGAFLSGGLDSTLVVALLAKFVVDEPLQTFSGSSPTRTSTRRRMREPSPTAPARSITSSRSIPRCCVAADAARRWTSLPTRWRSAPT